MRIRNQPLAKPFNAYYYEEFIETSTKWIDDAVKEAMEFYGPLPHIDGHHWVFDTQTVTNDDDDTVRLVINPKLKRTIYFEED